MPRGRGRPLSENKLTNAEKSERFYERRREAGIPLTASTNQQIVKVLRSAAIDTLVMEDIIKEAAQNLADLGYDHQQSERAVRERLQRI